MDWLNIFFGVIGIVSLVFSVYTYYKTENKKVIEAAKVAMQKERIKNSHYALTGILHTVDSIVQIPKKEEVSTEQLQNLARVARGQVYLLGKQLEIEHARLKNWQFGKLIESEPDIPFSESPEEEKLANPKEELQ